MKYLANFLWDRQGGIIQACFDSASQVQHTHPSVVLYNLHVRSSSTQAQSTQSKRELFCAYIDMAEGGGAYSDLAGSPDGDSAPSLANNLT